MTYDVEQIIPANGWWVVIDFGDGEPIEQPVVAFALQPDGAVTGLVDWDDTAWLTTCTEIMHGRDCTFDYVQTSQTKTWKNRRRELA